MRKLDLAALCLVGGLVITVMAVLAQLLKLWINGGR